MLTVPHSRFCLHSIISGMHNDKQSSTIPAYQATVIWRLQEQKIEIPSFTCADVALFVYFQVNPSAKA
ncbi:hypothetical protein ES332_A11G290400v1 [Gossypium tomentosum]|nr:hypothetical protein ES332_A11G290400v1 [Gossypium tomentosum]